ncbi:uncharacterized protein LOC141633542 isoform X3 [Silene latifolia]|uniref:uncharacterized protein LOC141633542 isoform X3 n=1 Tax=Silene latifolia TaxID=37657 RepID=UPI003D77A98B
MKAYRKKMKNSTPNPCRNLEKANLGGVIFGCTNKTMNECLTKQIFGLPAQHFGYVKNIDPGLPLFLFNYSKRSLHGIYEAASPGQLNINPYGWTRDGSERTGFPAQVLIRTLKNCRPLLENQFSPVIQENYYTHSHFCFELDHVQANKLIALFSTQVVAPAPSTRNPGNSEILNLRPPRLRIGECNENVASDPSTHHMDMSQYLRDDTETNVHKSSRTSAIHFEVDVTQEKEITEEDNVEDNSLLLSNYPSVIAQLMLEVRELKAFKQESTDKIAQLEHHVRILESEVKLLQGLDDRMLEPLPGDCETFTLGTMAASCSGQQPDFDDIIFMAGGYDGKSWLASFEAYYPSKDNVEALCPMSSVRSYASVARLKGEIYVIGGCSGGSHGLWYDTVERYSPLYNEWTMPACLNKKKGNLSAVTLHDKIFALGGGDGVSSFSDVEMFDLDVGRWISARSMLEKRFALAAVEFNGALYAVGGFDGQDYLSSTERFDPREHSWSRLGSMNTTRGCHSMVVLNEKLYAVGGFDGNSMISSVEVFDPRLGTWRMHEPMNYHRGYSIAVVLNNNIYAIGGVDENENIVDQVERYEEGLGWQVTDLKGVGPRSFASAIV